VLEVLTERGVVVAVAERVEAVARDDEVAALALLEFDVTRTEEVTLAALELKEALALAVLARKPPTFVPPTVRIEAVEKVPFLLLPIVACPAPPPLPPVNHAPPSTPSPSGTSNLCSKQAHFCFTILTKSRVSSLSKSGFLPKSTTNFLSLKSKYARHSMRSVPSHPEKNHIVRSKSRALAVAPHNGERSGGRVGRRGRRPVEERDLER